MTPMSYYNRIKEKRFSDSEVVHFYIDNREAAPPSTFIREVGDFVAHRDRDKGHSLEVTLSAFSQLAFFQTYQSTKPKRQLDPIGPCPWWLKSYFEAKLKLTKDRDLKRKLGFTKKEVTRKISSWFPTKDRFPEAIEALSVFEFFDIAQYFSSSIVGVSAFSLKGVKSELSNALGKYGISKTDLDDFIVATAVMLHGRTITINHGVSAKVQMCVNKRRHVSEVIIDEETGRVLRHGARYLADGSLGLHVSTSGSELDGLVGVGFEFLDTEVDTEKYFDRSLVVSDAPFGDKLDLSKTFDFESARVPMVRAV